ncbi:MAG: LysR substrate-binding domain-containing protein [Myxococcota bacterium]|nr:LysR substrate-binding domain-containing protein [Myxococcota bacterium]
MKELPLELRTLRYFVAVAEQKHFGRAALEVGIAQPPLSRQIQRLEQNLGFSLFDRSRRKIELTAAGEVLLGHARSLLDAVETAIREAERTSLGERGRVAVGYPSSLAYTGLVGLLRAFRAEFPDVELTVRELSITEQLDAIKNGQLDVGFVRAPIADPSLSAECVRREPLVIALPIDHALARQSRLELARLAEEPFVFFPRPRAPWFFDLLIGLCQKAGYNPRILQEVPQADVLSLVAAGFGISIMPESVREMRRADVVFRPFVGAPTTELLLVWRSEDTSPSRRAFVNLVRQVGVTTRRSPRGAGSRR